MINTLDYCKRHTKRCLQWKLATRQLFSPKTERVFRFPTCKQRFVEKEYLELDPSIHLSTKKLLGTHRKYWNLPLQMDLSCQYLMALFCIRKFIFLFQVHQPVFRSGMSVLNAIIHSIHTIFCLSPFLSYHLYSSDPVRENKIKCFYVREKFFEENIKVSCHLPCRYNIKQ